MGMGWWSERKIDISRKEGGRGGRDRVGKGERERWTEIGMGMDVGK